MVCIDTCVPFLGALATEALHRQVSPFLLRRLEEDVLQDLPPSAWELSPLQVSLLLWPTMKVRTGALYNSFRQYLIVVDRIWIFKQLCESFKDLHLVFSGIFFLENFRKLPSRSFLSLKKKFFSFYRFSYMKTSPSLRSRKVWRKQFLTSMKKTKTRKQAKIILTFSRLVLISFLLPYNVYFTRLIENLIMDTSLSSVLTTNNLMQYEYSFNLTCK